MTRHDLDLVLAALPPLDLLELAAGAQLLTRTDRKYLVDPSTLATVLAGLPAGTRVLDAGGGVWHRYATTYHDTPELLLHRLAATKRPQRHKLRTRTYVEGGLTMVESKTKDRRGRTVKRRHELPEDVDATTAVREHAANLPEARDHAHRLGPNLTTTHRRTTLVLPGGDVRVTVDIDFEAALRDGTSTGLPDTAIVETKTTGLPSAVDRLLWRTGSRPLRFSKYTTALAALHPDLPANRWHRVLVEHFDRPHPLLPHGAAPRTAATTSS